MNCGERNHRSHGLVLNSELVVRLLVEKGQKLMKKKGGSKIQEKEYFDILINAKRGGLRISNGRKSLRMKKVLHFFGVMRK